MSAVNFAVRYTVGGYASVKIRPQFAFNHMGADANGVKVVPSASNQEFFDGTISEWNAANNNSEIYDDVQVVGLAATSGTLIRKLITFDSPGAIAMRLQVIGDTLTGDDAGAVVIDYARVDNQTHSNKNFH
jgi:regulator of RNase E activity RraA